MKIFVQTLLLILILMMPLISISQTQNIKVWPDKVPGAISNPSYKEETIYDGSNKTAPRVSKVTDPELLVYLPSKEKANGTAVIICPGGGYGRLAMDHEGYDVAAWFNEMGVAGIILKYRLPHESIMENKSVGPLQDVQEAIRIVRRNAADWNINPSKVGVMGYSAGGHLASTASTHYNEKVYEIFDSTSARPDFSLLIYPVISMKPGTTHGGSRENLLGKNPSAELENRFSNELQVNSKTPPTFLVHSTDDKVVPVENSINYYLALKNNGVRAELHIYEKGGHGYGFGRGNGTENTWQLACINWLKTNKFLP